MAAFVSTFTDVGLINTTTNAGTITLPATSQIPYRQIILKDAYGNLSNKTLTLSTQAGEVFEDGRTTRVFKDSFGFQTLYGYNGTWYFLGGTAQNAATISSLVLSTVNGQQPVVLPNLLSTVTGLGTAGYVSTSQLLSTSYGLFVQIQAAAASVSGSQLTSTTVGLGTLGYVSSISGVVSTPNLLNLVSTQNLLNLISSPNLISTTAGLERYISSFIDPAELASSIRPFISTPNLTNLVSTANLINLVSTANLTNLVSTTYLDTQVASTVRGLGTAGFLSSVPGVVSTPNLLNLVSTQNLVNLVSTQNLLNLISSPNLISTTAGLERYISSFIDPQELASSIRPFISTPNLTNLVSTANLINLVSTANLTNLVSTTYLDTQVASTVRGLGTAGYLSSVPGVVSTPNLINLVSTQNLVNLVSTQNLINLISSPNLISTTAGLERYISSFIDPAELASSIRPFISIPNLTGIVSTPNLINLVSTQNLLNLVSTQNLVNLVSTTYLDTQVTSTVRGLGTAGYLSSVPGVVSTPNLLNLVSTQNLVNLVSTQNLLNLISSPNLISTTAGLERYISSFIDPAELASSIRPFISVPNLTNLVSTANLINLVSTQNLVNLVSTTYLDTQVASTVRGLGTAGYLSSVPGVVSTPNLINLVSTQNLLNLISSPNLISTTAGLERYISSFIDPQELASSIRPFISVPNLTNLVSTANLINLVSTANLRGLVSTSFLDTTLQSTVGGLGTSEYVSTASLYSTIARWSEYQATSAIILASTNAMIINPTPLEPGTEGIYPLRIQTTVASIYDSNNGPGQLELGTLSFTNSSLNESYLLGNQSFLKGSVSSLALGYFSVDGSNLVSSMGSLFLSSVFLGNVGGSLVGQITTDATATDLYWKGSKLNSQSGSGVTLSNLQSTVGGLGTASYVSTSQLTSTIERWATYPAVSSIVFANAVDATRNEIVSPGFTFLNLVNEVGVLATTSSTTDGIYPTRQFLGAGLSIVDKFDPLNPGNFNYYYNIVAGQSYTGSVSSLAIVDPSSAPAALYLSSLYFGDSFGAQFGSLESGQDYKNLFYNGAQLAYVSSLSDFISTPQLVSTTGGITSNYSSFFSTTIATYAFPYSGAELYLNYTQTVTPYYQLGINNIIGTNASNVTTVNGNTSNNLIVGFQSDFYIPEFIISGLWTVSLFSQASGTGLAVYAALYQRNPTTTTETLIGTSSNSPFIVPTTKVSLDLTFDVPYTTITSGNTLVIKIFANNSGSPSRDLTTFYENGNYSHVATTLGTGAIATNLFRSTVVGLGSLGYVSSLSLVSTTRGLQTSGFISTPNLLNLVSTQNLVNLVSTQNLVNLVSTPNLINLVSTQNLLNLISSPNLISTTAGLERYISSFIDPAELASSIRPFISIPNLTGLVSTPNLINLVSTQNLLNLVSTQNLVNLVSTTYLDTQVASTVRGLGTAGYLSSVPGVVSTPNLLNLVSTQNLLNLVSTQNLVNLVSTQNLINLISSPNLISTTAGLEQYISSFIDPAELASSIRPFISIPNLTGIVSTPNLINLVSTQNLLNLVSTQNLVNLVSTTYLDTQVASTVRGLGTAGYLSSVPGVVSTPNLLNLVSTQNLINLVSTPNLNNLVSTQNLVNLVSTQNLLNLISSPNLISTTAGLERYISSFIDPAELASSIRPFISIPNLLGLVSTTFLDTQLASTVRGLGTAGYLSSIPANLSTMAFFASSILASTMTTSSLQVQSLTIGTGTGWVNLGPLQTVAISSIQDNTNALYANTSFFGTTSSVTALQFYGLFGNYNNTVVAEVSTGAGIQELLMFKGSSTSDRVRVQTTGNFVVETGVSARLFNSNTTQTLSNATPAFIVNSSSNVGIQTTPAAGVALDVAGTGRFVTLSSLALFASSIVAPYIFQPQYFTF